MGNATLTELRRKADTAWARLGRHLEGLEPHLDRAPAPGEWSAREVLSHLLGPEGAGLEPALRRFTTPPYPTLDFHPGDPAMSAGRKTLTLAQLRGALDAQRQAALGYLSSLPETELQARKVRIPAFKQFLGTEEISLAVFTGAMFEFHWTDHAGQLGKIRQAVGLPPAG
jgi:hypothetical protein